MRPNSLRISPLPSRKPKRVNIGMLTSGGIKIGEKYPKIVYCNSAAPILRIARQRGGKALIARTGQSTRWLKFEVGNAEYFPGVYCDDIDQVIAWRDYCYEQAITARSVQSMAFYLMRNSLGGYFDVSRGGTVPFDKFPAGPRMQARPGVWSNVYQADIVAAYLWGIGRFSPATEFYVTKNFRLRDVADNPGSWALVSFRTKNSSWGALPLINNGVTYFPNRDYGWSKPTLISSYDLDGNHNGAEIRKIKAWIAGRPVFEPFRPFMFEMSKLRNSSDFPTIAKQAGNTLWGSFCSSSKMAVVTFPGEGKPAKITNLPDRPPLCLPIGYSVAAKLRARLFSVTDHPSIVQAHTDGFITTAIRSSLFGIGHPAFLPDSAEPGEWRNAGCFSRVEILSPSWYRTVDMEGKESYKIAGRNYRSGDRTAEVIFNKQREREE